jgi:hypothetical protein
MLCSLSDGHGLTSEPKGAHRLRRADWINMAKQSKADAAIDEIKAVEDRREQPAAVCRRSIGHEYYLNRHS